MSKECECPWRGVGSLRAGVNAAVISQQGEAAENGTEIHLVLTAEPSLQELKDLSFNNFMYFI